MILACCPLSGQDKDAVRALMVAPTATPDENARGVTWVLAVAVEQYRNVSPLSYTGEDAASFVKAFREVGGITPSRLFLIADGQPESLRLETNATSVRGAISQVCSLAKPADTFILFFSGHGFRDNENQMYLATNDFDPAEYKNTSVPVSFVKEQLGNCRAENQLIFLDACHSGAFNSADNIDGRALANNLAERSRVAVISSCTDGQVSVESSKLKHGVFTWWLVNGLRGQANSTVDAQIDIQELFRYLSDRVPAEAKKVNDGIQTPVFAARNLTQVTTVMRLNRPDRPSVLVAAKNDVPVGDIGYDPRLIQAMASFASADPVLVIGRLKWILENERPRTPAYAAADKALQFVDEQILKGQIRLPEHAAP
jgi:uncharacterized caspase-like protein